MVENISVSEPLATGGKRRTVRPHPRKKIFAHLPRRKVEEDVDDNTHNNDNNMMIIFMVYIIKFKLF